MMALKLINPESVRQDLRGLTLWFSHEERHLLIVHDERGIIFFEYINSKKIVEGGRNLPLKAGEIGSSRTPLSYLRRARIIAYKSTGPSENFDELKSELEQCQGMAPYLQQALKSYLAGENRRLDFTAPLKDYRPLRTSNALFRAMAPLYRYRMFQFLNGWSLPILVAIIIGAISFSWIYDNYKKYNPARECFKMGHFSDCSEAVRQALVSQEAQQTLPENALQNVLLACKNRTQTEGCDIIYEYNLKKNNEEWVRQFIVPACRPKTLSNVCHLLSRIWTQAGKIEEGKFAQILQCQYLRSLVNNKLAVETLALNLMHELRECQNSLAFIDGPMTEMKLESLCRDWQICTPWVANNLRKKTNSQKVYAFLEKSCQQYQDDQCIILSCFHPDSKTRKDNLQFFRPKGVLFWKDGGSANNVVSKAIPQFYHTLTVLEQEEARAIWNKECRAGDIRSCFQYTATSNESALPLNIKKFCEQLPGYFKKASLADLLTLRLSLKLSGE